MSLQRLSWWSCVAYRRSTSMGPLLPEQYERTHRLTRALMMWYRNYGLSIDDPDKDDMLSALLGFGPSFKRPIFSFDGSEKIPYWGIKHGKHRFWVFQCSYFMRFKCDKGVAPSEIQSFLRELGELVLRPSLSCSTE